MKRLLLVTMSVTSHFDLYVLVESQCSTSMIWRPLAMEWLFLALAIPTGIAAARIDVLITWTINRVRHGRLNISGNWAEWVPNSSGRQFSIGTIGYNVLRRRYNFDGTNYNNDGTPYCHWQTVTSYIDYEKLEFHYTFATKDVASLQTTSYGNGVLQLVRRDDSLVPEDGYYLYATPGNTAILASHTMRSISEIPESRNMNAKELLAQTFPEHSDALE